MRRLLLFVLAGLLAFLAQPAMANHMIVRGSVSHHHHAFFQHNHVFFHHHNRIFFASAINPFAFSPTFTLASPFIAQPLPFSTWPGGWGSGAFGGGWAPDRAWLTVRPHYFRGGEEYVPSVHTWS